MRAAAHYRAWQGCKNVDNISVTTATCSSLQSVSTPLPNGSTDRRSQEDAAVKTETDASAKIAVADIKVTPTAVMTPVINTKDAETNTGDDESQIALFHALESQLGVPSLADFMSRACRVRVL